MATDASHFPRLPGYGAFAKADVRDAKRRRPDIDLSGYAVKRGLDMLGSRNAAGFFAALPLDEQLQFNVLRGSLPGSEQGILFHHVLPLAVSPDGSVVNAGGLYGYVYNPPGAKLRVRDVLGGLIPLLDVAADVVSDLRRPLAESEKGDPLGSCIGVPCTVAAVLVPEVALEQFTIDNRPKPRFVPHHREDIEGWTLLSREPPDRRLLERFLSDATRDALRILGARPYVKLEVSYGTLAVRVNGYLRGDEELDGLAQAACVLARELRAAGELVADRRPFDRPLPAPELHAPAPWGDALDAHAWKHRLSVEDSAAYHRAFPALAVPGRAFGVLRGELADGVIGRVAWHTEKSLATNNDGRNAVLLPAPPGAEPTPRAGVRLADEALNYWVGDGIMAVWELRSKELRGDLGDMDGLVGRALELRRRRARAAAPAGDPPQPVRRPA
jgi:hypothetical protein